jgi:hypothetical protein
VEAAGVKRRAIIQVVMGVMGVSGGAASGDVAILTTAHDATLIDRPGDPVTYANGASFGMFAGMTAEGHRRRAVMSFDFSAIPAGATITRVDLTLTCTRTASGANQFSLHPVTAAWGEGATHANGLGGLGNPALAGDVTWVSRYHEGAAWSTPGGDFLAAASGSASVSGVGTYTWTTTPALVANVQAWLDNPGGNFGWLLKGVNETGTRTAKRFATHEVETASERPKLRVEYTIPAPGSLMPLAGAGLLALRRRR